MSVIIKGEASLKYNKLIISDEVYRVEETELDKRRSNEKDEKIEFNLKTTINNRLITRKMKIAKIWKPKNNKKR